MITFQLINMKKELNDNWDYSSSLEAINHIQLKKKYTLFIDGKWVAPSKNNYFKTINPANEENAADFSLDKVPSAGSISAFSYFSQRPYKNHLQNRASQNRAPSRE